MNQEGKLTLHQANRYSIIQSTLEGRMSNAEAARALGISTRQVKRLKSSVRRRGPKGIVHGNTGREPHNKTLSATRQKVIDLARTEYVDYNFSHLSDELEEERQILLSDETLRLWLRPLDHGRPPRRRRPYRRRRKPREQEGELIYLDGSPHPWFGPDHSSCCLILCSDDATGKPLYGTFQPEEDRDGCFEVCYHVFRKFGLPAAFYLDRGSQFITTRHGGVHRCQDDSQLTYFQLAMKELCVGVIFAHSPQARGRHERLNGTFQDRLLVELKRHGIHEMKQATHYLNATYIPKHCRHLARPAANPTSAWRPAPSEDQLKRILCAKVNRTIAKDNTVRLNGVVYQLRPPTRLHRVQAQLWFDGSVHFSHPNYGELTIVRRRGSANSQNQQQSQ